MAYFNQFPLYEYSLTNDKTRKLLTNIMRRVKMRANVKANVLVMDKYNVQDGETPDIVAAKYYGSPLYHYVVLIVNNITSRFDWPVDMRSFGPYLEEKYGLGNSNDAHHYEKAQESGDLTKMLTVASDVVGAGKVTNREHEEAEQDKKRQISLLDKYYLGDFVEEHRKLIRGVR